MWNLLLAIIGVVLVVAGFLTFTTGNSGRNYTREAGRSLLLLGAGVLLLIPALWISKLIAIVAIVAGIVGLFGVSRKKSAGSSI